MSESQLITSATSDLAHMELIDKVEARLLAIGAQRPAAPGESIATLPVKHHFTPGLYIREIFMPAGHFLTSKIHKTEHPFVVSRGACWVLTEKGWEYIEAPHFGITRPGTRRFLAIVTDTIWTTFHVTDLTDPAAIDAEIIQEYENPLLAEVAQ